MVRASLVVLLVKNLPAMQENWVWTLGWQDPLEKGKATHSSILAWENCMDCIVHGVAKNLTQLSQCGSGATSVRIIWNFDSKCCVLQHALVLLTWKVSQSVKFKKYSYGTWTVYISDFLLSFWTFCFSFLWDMKSLLPSYLVSLVLSQIQQEIEITLHFIKLWFDQDRHGRREFSD